MCQLFSSVLTFVVAQTLHNSNKRAKIVHKMEKSLNFPIMQGLTEHTARPWPVLTFCSNKLIRPLYLALYTLVWRIWINIFLFLSSIFVSLCIQFFQFSPRSLGFSLGRFGFLHLFFICVHTHLMRNKEVESKINFHCQFLAFNDFHCMFLWCDGIEFCMEMNGMWR